MLSSRTLSLSILTAAVATATVASWAVRKHNARRKRQRIRQKLPFTLSKWRQPGPPTDAFEELWNNLEEVSREAELKLWDYYWATVLNSPDSSFPLSTGFSYALPTQTIPDRLGNVGCLRIFCYQNSLTRIARTREGHDLVVRVLVIGDQGREHYKMLKKIATGENSLYSNNHVLSMFGEFRFEDIIFGLLPRVGAEVSIAYGYWPKKTVGDIVDFLFQALEPSLFIPALVFIHNLNIAHRDVFRENLLVQWHPESLVAQKISPSRPRVYLIDFEFAVEFPPDCPEAERVSTGVPLGGSLTDPELYMRPPAPELASDQPYDPFKLDVWQLGYSFTDFSSTIPAIEEILQDMTHDDPAKRPDAKHAFDRLEYVLRSIPLASLLIPPIVNLRYW